MQECKLDELDTDTRMREYKFKKIYNFEMSHLDRAKWSIEGTYLNSNLCGHQPTSFYKKKVSKILV